LSKVLRWDKRAKGGLKLATDVPELGLSAGDRLEPSDSCPDVGAVSGLAPPFTLTFWRDSEESISRHRNPLFRASYGLAAETSMTVDTLHALYLGVMHVWCREAVWQLLTSGVYGASATSGADLVVCCLAMRTSLFNWYKARRAKFPSEGLTEVTDWIPSMVGKHGKPKLKTKAAETWSVLLFLVDELEKLRGLSGPHWQRLVMAGRRLESLVLRWRACSWTLPPHVIEDGLCRRGPNSGVDAL
jgi:hypothetical protein